MRAAASRLLALAGLSLASPALGAQAPAAPVPATVPAIDPLGSVQFDMPSRITGRTYRISLYKPATPAPAKGWPVITVLDSRSTFATAASQVSLRTALGRPGAVVVGVGYPRNEDTFRLRQIDLTPSQMPPGSAVSPGTSPTESGQAALFERFLIEELRPVIAAMAPVDSHDQSLIGYSLGGLFALGVMFEHPTLYRTIVAGSPSIWWNEREVLGKEATFAAAAGDPQGHRSVHGPLCHLRRRGPHQRTAGRGESRGRVRPGAVIGKLGWRGGAFLREAQE